MKGSAFHGGNVRQKTTSINVGKTVLTNLIANNADQKHQGTENKFRYQFNFIVPSNCIKKNNNAIVIKTVIVCLTCLNHGSWQQVP